MPWCYRACRTVNEDASETWSIREYYTDENGEEVGFTVSPAGPHGESFDELKMDLQRMFIDASSRPVLELYVFTCSECGDKDVRQQTPRSICQDCIDKS